MAKLGTVTGLGRAPVGIVGALVVAIWLAWAWTDGGYEAESWGPWGIGLVLLVALSVALAPPQALGRCRLSLLVAVAAFVAWNFASMLWADFPGVAWIGSDKTALYAAGVVVFAAWPWPPRARLTILGLFASGIGIIAAVVLVQAALSEQPAAIFKAGRLLEPTGYENSTVALWMLGLWPALVLGSTRALSPVPRGFFLGLAGLLLGMAVLGQSRGWLFLLPLTIAIFLLLVPQRLRSILGLVLLAAALLPVLDPVLNVYRSAGDGPPSREAIQRAAVSLLAASSILGLVGVGWGLLDRVVRVNPRTHRVLGGAVAAMLVAAIIGGATVASVAVDDPVDSIERRWNDFTKGYTLGAEGSRFTGSLGTDRYTEWRIAWNEFLDHPAIGIGSDNYAASYLLERANNYHEVSYPHSIPLRLLSQLGLVGALLFGTVVACGLVLAARLRRQLHATESGAVAAALSVFAYWALHGSIDVFWEIPALAAPAFGMLALAGADPGVRDHGEPPHGRGLRLGALLAVVALALCLAVSVALPWLSRAFSSAAAAVWKRNPELAYERLDVAARLDPLSAEPLLLEGSIALRLRDAERTRAALAAALEREPKNWYASLQLGLLASYLGSFDEAKRFVDRTLELNPKDPVAYLTRLLIEDRVRIDPDAINELYRDGLNRELSLTAVLDLPRGQFRADSALDLR